MQPTLAIHDNNNNSRRQVAGSMISAPLRAGSALRSALSQRLVSTRSALGQHLVSARSALGQRPAASGQRLHKNWDAVLTTHPTDHAWKVQELRAALETELQ